MVLPETSRIERALLLIALVFIVILAVKMTTYLVSLFLMAIILTMLTLPAVVWLRAKGLSNFSAVLVITVVACLIILGGFFLTALSFNSLVTDLPQYQDSLNTRLADISAILVSFGFPSDMLSSASFNIGDTVGFAITWATSIFEGTMFLFFVAVTTFFILLDMPQMAIRLEHLFGRNPEGLRQYTRMSGYLIDFIVVRTETNFIHGVLFGGFLGIMGVHGAIL